LIIHKGVGMRRPGKSWAANMAREAALDKGEKVLVCTKESNTLYRRKKHLTSIEILPRSKPASTALYDDPFNI